MAKVQEYLQNCLYFSANSLSRLIARMAEEEFRVAGLSPSHAFLMMLVNENEGVGPKKLSEYLQLAPSTVTRFVDSLAGKGYLRRETEGKTARIFTTKEGKALQEAIADAWKRLYDRYSDILGEEEGKKLTEDIAEANRMLAGRYLH